MAGRSKARPLTDDEREHVGQHLGLAFSTAKALRRVHGGLTFDEVLSCCFEGLVYAARTWDPALGSWSTCATTWMRSRVSMEAKDRHLVHLPAYVQDDRRSAKAECLAAADVVMNAGRVDPAGHDVGVPAAAAADVEREEEAGRVRAAVSRLPEPQRSIVWRSVAGGESFREIARDYVFDRQAVGRHRDAGLKRLRAMLGGPGGEDS